MLDIKQTDLTRELKVSREVILRIENKLGSFYNLDTLEKVIDKLNLRSELSKGNNYIAFVLNKPHILIKAFRNEHKITQVTLSKLLGVNTTTVKRWEQKKSVIKFSNYEKLKKIKREYSKLNN